MTASSSNKENKPSNIQQPSKMASTHSKMSSMIPNKAQTGKPTSAITANLKRRATEDLEDKISKNTKIDYESIHKSASTILMNSEMTNDIKIDELNKIFSIPSMTSMITPKEETPLKAQEIEVIEPNHE